MERVQKILSQAGVASRRASERLMLDGRVTVNGATVTELGTKADPARDDIRVDGRRIRLAERRLYLLLNKPRGYVSTRSDPQRRPTVIELIGIREYVYPVGRLDFDSEGLLLLTNDGDLAARLTHPRHLIERVYEARVLGVPDDHDLVRLRRGIIIDGRRTEPADVSVMQSGRPSQLRRAGQGRQRGTTVDQKPPPAGKDRSTAIVQITVREGRNRQVRKMFDAIGHPVDHLKRIAIGPIRDNRLKTGQWRELTGQEVAQLQAAAASRAARATALYEGRTEK
jgi:pseudouridine synthase